MRLATESDRNAMLHRFDEKVSGPPGAVDEFFREHDIDPIGAIALAVRHTQSVERDDGLDYSDPAAVRNAMVTLAVMMFGMGAFVMHEKQQTQ